MFWVHLEISVLLCVQRCPDVFPGYPWRRGRLEEVKLLEKAVNKGMKDGGATSRLESGSAPTRTLK